MKHEAEERGSQLEIDWDQTGKVRLFLKAKDFRQGSGGQRGGNVDDG